MKREKCRSNTHNTHTHVETLTEGLARHFYWRLDSTQPIRIDLQQVTDLG